MIINRALTLMFLVFIILSTGPAYAEQVSGFICLSQSDAESMLKLNVEGAEIDDYTKEDQLGKELLASEACRLVPDAMPLDAYEVYRGPVVRAKGPAKQIVGFALEPGGMAVRWGLDFAQEPSLRGPVPDDHPPVAPRRIPGRNEAT